ncbi:hypothetical protein [Cylindrospermopsis raciborskii]|nr:hypothetical protein [Cylindrospermopsis raciborskii]
MSLKSRKSPCDRRFVLGGGKLTASLLEFDLVDELWLTICP